MRLRFFTKQNMSFISASIILLALISIILFLFDISSIIIYMGWAIYFTPVIAYMVIDYFTKRSFYKEIIQLSNELEDKYLLPNIIEKPGFPEGDILYELLYDAGKSMLEQVNYHKQAQMEYREYIEQWVHEIKTPIAAINLLLENSGDKTTILEELSYIDGYIQQVLYYARSQNPQQDFFVKEFNLDEVISDVIKKHARSFITSGIQLKYKHLEAIVFADSKWTSYILEQIITNAIKYTKGNNKTIAIYGEDVSNSYVLTVADNGVGIPCSDLIRIFDKGFTGENGRKFGRSTGMGLYLCKTLCDKLFIGLTVNSVEGNGTKVQLTFPKSSLFTQ